MPGHVTLLIDSLGPGGAQTQLVQLAAALPEQGWRTTVAWYNHREPFHKVPEQAEARPLPRRGRADPRFPQALAGLLQAGRTDVVHAWLPAPALYASLFRQVPGMAPLVTAVRCSRSLLERDRSQGAAQLAAALLSDAVTVNARDVVEWLAERGVPEERVHFLPNLLPARIGQRVPSTPEQRRALLERLGLDPGRAPVVQLGRFDAYKNQVGLVRAVLRLREQGVEVPPLVLAGAPAEPWRVDEVKEVAREAGFTDLHVLPPVEDVATLLEAARVSVLASRSEGTPNVVLESLGLGCLVVATAVGETPQLVRPDETGLLVAPEDTAALAAALQRALAMPADQARAMGQRARQDMLARFSAPAIARQHAQLYDEVHRRGRTGLVRRLGPAMRAALARIR